MESVAVPAITLVFENIFQVINLTQGLDKDVKQLQETLVLTQQCLNDAEGQGHTVEPWLKSLEAYAFEADNILDKISYHFLRRKVMQPKNKVLSFCTPSNPILENRKMALKIREVTADFHERNKKATGLNLPRKVKNAPPPTNASSETDSLAFDPIFIGRDGVVEEIVEKLSQISGEETFSNLAIVGMGGMGKTTLTRKVFNHEQIKARFGLLIWVYVSEVFEPIILLKKILSTLMTSQNHGGDETREVIVKKLQVALKDKTYLLVLDDIWNGDQSKWDNFEDSMRGATSTKGNGIVITTRNENVASIVRPFHTHRLRGLSDEECWSVIKAKAFRNGKVPPSGVEIGREIAKTCGGLPLAANALGGVLFSKPVKEWRCIIKENWLSYEEVGENIGNILRLSFRHLPSPSHKKCFTYCLIYPKGRRIKKQELIEQWMAEGFLLQADEKEEKMELVGEKIFNVLLHRSLLQVSEKGEDEYGDFETYYVMHDIVHDLAIKSDFGQARYMYMNHHTNDIAKESAKCLRALILNEAHDIFGLDEMKSHALSHTMFSHSISLRVLVIIHATKELPYSIRKLIHLRLLDVSTSCIEELPKWIGELYHLQTLRADSMYLKKFSGTFKYLTNLRHLYIPKGLFSPTLGN